MSNGQLELEIARATGESLQTIRRRGFQLATPALVNFDPEPSGPPAVMDWDEHHRVEVPRFRSPRRVEAAAA